MGDTAQTPRDKPRYLRGAGNWAWTLSREVPGQNVSFVKLPWAHGESRSKGLGGEVQGECPGGAVIQVRLGDSPHRCPCHEVSQPQIILPQTKLSPITHSSQTALSLYLTLKHITKGFLRTKPNDSSFLPAFPGYIHATGERTAGQGRGQRRGGPVGARRAGIGLNKQCDLAALLSGGISCPLGSLASACK